ncbi:tannase/feruloyl esterase family alpha/beta hydrolase [Novosphingobium sp. PS1R-30]|uniref:Tannase/feruloyl esterase family alpha/beta hydrolase n=1 Tax=Novosphingobium anseongense TaxID=3133436 RepID=A0ABU8S1N3_9SPHN
MRWSAFEWPNGATRISSVGDAFDPASQKTISLFRNPTIMQKLAKRSSWLAGAALAGTLTATLSGGASQPASATEGGLDLSSVCSPGAMQAVADKVAPGIRIQATGGVRLVGASTGVPAYCQARGSFVTNPKTGKTANFLATFPANWNGRYLQYGCFGHCGSIVLNDAASPLVTIVAQGKPGDAIRRGYATFGTDQGHSGMNWASWAYKSGGGIDIDAIEDFYYRADKVLAQVGKQLTSAVFSAAGAPGSLRRSYFMGCSGGGRDALVAATYFPEMFDGIVAGSPYADMMGVGFQGTGMALATIRSPQADLSPELIAMVAPIVTAKCDKADGVADGLIQNPAACNFRAQRDLPLCEAGAPADRCFTKDQAETVSTVLSAVTDEHGRVIQPGYTVSDFDATFRPKTRPANLTDPAPWPDSPAGVDGLPSSGFSILKAFVHGDEPDFAVRALFSFRQGGPGPVKGYHIVVPRAEVERARESARMGIGTHPQLLRAMIGQDRKLLIWSNLGDRGLTPFMMTNYYKQLARTFGGYAKLQRNVRLFSLPSTAHCSLGGNGPGNFDALGAIEDWVENGKAPEALPAALYPTNGPMTDYSKAPKRTMPLCKFPEMARYSGTGNVYDAANWRCSPQDKRMLRIGESGREAGVID